MIEASGSTLKLRAFWDIVVCVSVSHLMHTRSFTAVLIVYLYWLLSLIYVLTLFECSVPMKRFEHVFYRTLMAGPIRGRYLCGVVRQRGNDRLKCPRHLSPSRNPSPTWCVIHSPYVLYKALAGCVVALSLRLITPQLYNNAWTPIIDYQELANPKACMLLCVITVCINWI